jgi:hypothetical protein
MRYATYLDKQPGYHKDNFEYRLLEIGKLEQVNLQGQTPERSFLGEQLASVHPKYEISLAALETMVKVYLLPLKRVKVHRLSRGELNETREKWPDSATFNLATRSFRVSAVLLIQRAGGRVTSHPHISHAGSTSGKLQ